MGDFEGGYLNSYELFDRSIDPEGPTFLTMARSMLHGRIG